MKTNRRGFFKVATAATVGAAAAIKAEPQDKSRAEVVKSDAKPHAFRTPNGLNGVTSASIAGHASSAPLVFMFEPSYELTVAPDFKWDVKFVREEKG